MTFSANLDITLNPSKENLILKLTAPKGGWGFKNMIFCIVLDMLCNSYQNIFQKLISPKPTLFAVGIAKHGTSNQCLIFDVIPSKMC